MTGKIPLQFKSDLIWRDIPDYPLYKVSNYGQVWSDHYKKMLKGSPDQDGYYRVTLYNSKGRKVTMIHLLVAQIFLGERPKGLTVDHKSTIRTDNRALNLRYADLPTQTSNKKNCIKTSQYTGVRRHGNVFQAYIANRKAFTNVGSFETEEEALIARNRYILINDLPNKIQLI